MFRNINMFIEKRNILQDDWKHYKDDHLLHLNFKFKKELLDFFFFLYSNFELDEARYAWNLILKVKKLYWPNDDDVGCIGWDREGHS
jgi:hypothetical protein